MNGFVAANPEPAAEKTAAAHSAETTKTFAENTFIDKQPP
jgi:hypothetical protein